MLTNEETKRNIAANVRRLLVDRGWDQADLAERTGENDMQISRICRGTMLANAATLARIAEAFDVSMDRLTATPATIPPTKLRQPA